LYWGIDEAFLEFGGKNINLNIQLEKFKPFFSLAIEETKV
jgi:hypothetical protein